MKRTKKLAILFSALLCATALFAGCGNNNDAADSQGSDDSSKKTITIGCMPLNEPAVAAIKDQIADQGYEIDIKVFDGNNLPAEALMADEIDALILNHLPWINNFNEQNGSELTMVDGFAYASVFGLYSAKHDSIDEIPDNGTIIMSNDPSNIDRSLRLLDKFDLIKLGEKTGDYYTVLDIAENPKNLQLIEVETTSTAGSYQDADGSIAFSSVMRNAGFDAKAYLVEDGEKVNYPTGLFVNKGDEDSQWAKDIVAVTQTEEYREAFDAAFDGAYVILDN